jgi:hypothetical protein
MRNDSLLLFLLLSGNMGIDPSVRRRRNYSSKTELPERKKCMNPECNNLAETGYSHCSADCFRKHIKARKR